MNRTISHKLLCLQAIIRPEHVAIGGAVFTRWGRTTCPEEADLVYAGIVGGSLFSNHGGGANYLCLPSDPEWSVNDEGVGKSANIYGAEYKQESSFSKANAHGQSIVNHNVPCAACVSRTRVSALMIPARTSCYAGWTAEYSGHLMVAHFGHQGRTQFICVDGAPEVDEAGYRPEESAHLYLVGGVCGSLPCPAYINNRGLTCVLCTK